MMDISRVKAKGQITIPIEVRKLLNLQEGDKIVFMEQNGRVYVENAVKIAFQEIQEAFIGEAEKAGIQSDDDVNKLVKEVRKELWEERYVDHA